MLFFNRVCLQNVEKRANPYDVLGCSCTMPFEEIRQKFYALTRMYHPDMPHGDPVKFREINAAYRQLRAEYRSRAGAEAYKKAKTTSAAFTATNGAGSNYQNDYGRSSFWEELNQRAAAAEREKQQQRAKPAKGFESDTPPQPQQLRRNIVFLLNGNEIVLSAFAIAVVLLYGIQRYIVVIRMVHEKEQHLRNIDEGIPPPMPMEVNQEMTKRFDGRPDAKSLAEDANRLRNEVVYRRATQRRFDDFREFMFIHDPDGIGSRKVMTTRFSYQYVNEADIPNRCPIVRQFDSQKREMNYDTIVNELHHTLETTKWWSEDVGYAGGLIAKGMSCIPANSPNTAKWTFIEYVEADQDHHTAAPVCLAAIRNLRFEQVGMCQRISVSGNETLHKNTSVADEAGGPNAVASELKSGKSDIVTGSALPLKDLSIPLEKMKL